MTSQLIQLIESFVLPLGVLGVFLASVLEEIIAVIPSPIVQMGSGFLFFGGQPFTPGNAVQLFLRVAVPASLGVTIGSLAIYIPAYFGGKPAIDRWGKYFFVRWQDVEQAQNVFKRSWGDEAVIFIARALPIIPSVAIAALSGLLRVDVRQYLLFTFLGTLVRATFLGFIGWQAGSLYTQYSVYIDTFERAGAIVLAFSALAFFLYKKNKHRYGR